MPLNVLIAGGGVAGLEAALALRELAGDRVAVTVLAPDETFELKALSVREPFAAPHARRHALADVASEIGFSLRAGRLASVDVAERVVVDDGGARHPYDALLVAIGARPEPALAHATTFTGHATAENVHGMLQDLEQGYAKRIAFVAPAGASWPLPLYELALLTAERASSLGLDDVSLTVVTPEAAPLALFGPDASAAVASLLSERGVDVVANAYVEADSRVPALGLGPGHAGLPVDRVVALPRLAGPFIEGLPADAHGFLPIDSHCVVTGAEGVWAAGDGTTFPIKQGGIAAQQADAAAEAIAAAAGADVTPEPFRAVLRGMLLTGQGVQYLRAIAGATRGPSEFAEDPLWWPPTKVAGRRLGPWLWEREGGDALERPTDSGAVEVEREVDADSLPRPTKRLALREAQGRLELLELPPKP